MSDLDDLPRTLRRERERQKAAAASGVASGLSAAPAPDYGQALLGDELMAARVRRLDVPFFHLMLFFLKAVLAAIPALILLGAILWFAGHALQTYFPDLVKMKILISFPNG